MGKDNGLYYPQDMENDSLIRWLSENLSTNIMDTEKILCMVIALLLQIYISIILKLNESGVDENYSKIVFEKWQYYWNNPLLYISLFTLPKVFEQLLIIFIPRFIRFVGVYRMLGITLLFISLILLTVFYDINYIIVLPCLMASWGILRTSSKSKMRSKILTISKITMGVIAVMYVYFTLDFYFTRSYDGKKEDKSNLFIKDLNHLSKTRASMGVIWYLADLLIDYVKDYFSFLLSVLPLIMAIGITTRFFFLHHEQIYEQHYEPSEWKDDKEKDTKKGNPIKTRMSPTISDKVSTSSSFSLSSSSSSLFSVTGEKKVLGKARKNEHHLEVFHVIVVIINFMKYDLSLIDIGFCISLLFMRHESIVLKMRYKAIIAIGLIITCVLSPLMHFMWVQTGNGNANFLFFQGLALWIVAALGIIEFVRASLRYNEYDEKRGEET